MCSGEEAIRAFVKAGWRVARQKGSHVSLVKQGNPNVLTVPLHEVTVEEFRRMLE